MEDVERKKNEEVQTEILGVWLRKIEIQRARWYRLKGEIKLYELLLRKTQDQQQFRKDIENNFETAVTVPSNFLPTLYRTCCRVVWERA